MAYQQPDNDLLKMLDSAIQVLSFLCLPNSVGVLKNLRTYINNTIPKQLDGAKINDDFKKFQIDSTNEFSNTSHKAKVLQLLNGAMRVTITENQTEMRNILNEPNVIEINKQRIESFKILKTLEKIILNGSTSDEEKIIGLSYYYLNIIDGVYRNSVRVCYIWHQLKRKDLINKATIHETRLLDISKYFSNNQIDLTYFEGWNRIVRNAVGHSTFEYDSGKQKAIYYDHIAKKSIELSLQELKELIEKLFDVFYALMLINQILRINDICDTFRNRYA